MSRSRDLSAYIYPDGGIHAFKLRADLGQTLEFPNVYFVNLAGHAETDVQKHQLHIHT